MTKKTNDQLMTRQREINERLGALDKVLQTRELNDSEKKEQTDLLREYEQNKREIILGLQEEQAATMRMAIPVDRNAELREFLRKAKVGDKFDIPATRETISYGAQTGTVTYPGTGGYLQGITVVDLISTERPDGDVFATLGINIPTGVTGNKIQWAYAGGVEAAFANELEQTTERVINLDKQSPIQQRLTVRVRVTNQALENSNFDLQAYIVENVNKAIRQKVNFAALSTTKATDIFYGGFAQNTESGTYGNANYVPGKQVGTYSTFTKEIAAAMISKLATRNIPINGVVFVMGAEDFWTLKVTPFDAGSGIMLIGNDNRLLGIPVVVNNAINRSTQKGAVSGHNIGLGNFNMMPVMNHGNIRLSIDAASATASSTDEVITTINADFSMTVLKSAADAFVLYSKTNTNS